jgi:predicted transcriptional regulator
MTLKEYLEKCNQTPFEFALLSKISAATIYGVLAGKPIRLKTAKKIIRTTKKVLNLNDLVISSRNDYLSNTGNSGSMESA